MRVLSERVRLIDGTGAAPLRTPRSSSRTSGSRPSRRAAKPIFPPMPRSSIAAA